MCLDLSPISKVSHYAYGNIPKSETFLKHFKRYPTCIYNKRTLTGLIKGMNTEERNWKYINEYPVEEYIHINWKT